MQPARALAHDAPALHTYYTQPLQVYTVTLHGEQLRTDFRVINTGDKPFEFTAALHSYFEVGFALGGFGGRAARACGRRGGRC